MRSLKPNFVSFENEVRGLLSTNLSNNEWHAKWLNTLSYLENCGARKIAACEHPTLVKEEMLKHAAEEFRHAHYLKRQIQRISSSPFPDYSLSLMLGGFATLHYLSSLELKILRYLKETSLSHTKMREAIYLLVTYTIELRADELYPIYDALLRKMNSKVAVKSILLEEKEHLHEMTEALHHFPSGFTHAQQACIIEANLFQKWMQNIYETNSTYSVFS